MRHRLRDLYVWACVAGYGILFGDMPLEDERPPVAAPRRTEPMDPTDECVRDYITAVLQDRGPLEG